MYTIINLQTKERTQKIKSYEEAKRLAEKNKATNGDDYNLLSDGIAVWTTKEENSIDASGNTNAVYFN